MTMVILGVVVVGFILVFVGVPAVIYGAVIGLYFLCWRKIRSKALRIVVPTSSVLAIALPLYSTSLLDWLKFDERRQRFGGDHYLQTVERPEGIAFRGNRRNEARCGEICQELLFEDQVSYVEAVNEAWPNLADYQPRRYTKRVGEAECALVKKITGDPRSTPEPIHPNDYLRSRGYAPIVNRRILAVDQCIAIEKIDAFSAPVVVHFWPVERSPTASFWNRGSITHVDIYWHGRRDDADGLIAWQESAQVELLGFPPRLYNRRQSGLLPSFSFWTYVKYGAAHPRHFIGKALAVSLDGRYDISAASIPNLIGTLRGGLVPLVTVAADALAELGSVARSAEPALRDRLTDPNERVRRAAAYALARVSAEQQETIHALIPALADKSSNVRESVMHALGSFGPRAAPALPRLIPLIADSATWHASRYAVTKIGAAAVPDLTKALRSEDVKHSERAAFILGEIGLAASPALPVLRDLAKNYPQRHNYRLSIRSIERAIKASGSAFNPSTTDRTAERPSP